MRSRRILRAAPFALYVLVAAACGGGDDAPLPDGGSDAVTPDGGADGGAPDAPGDAGPPVLGDSEVFAPLAGAAEGIALSTVGAEPVLYVGLTGGRGIVRVSPGGEVTPFADVPGVLGIAVRADGSLVACGKADASDAAPGVIWEVDAAGVARVLLDRDGAGEPFALTNYIAVAPDDSLVFTDSAANRVHRADADGGNVALLTDAISYPNGLAFTPAGDALWVASWDGDALYRAPFAPDTGAYGAFTLEVSRVAKVDGLVATTSAALLLVTSGSGILRLAAGETTPSSVVDQRAILLPANGVMGQGAFGDEWLYIAALGSPRVHRVFVGEAGPALPIR